MSEVRVYADEDAGETAVVRGLRARGMDILTTIEARQCGATDQDQLAFAVQQGRSIYTFNVRDFARLHRECLSRGGQPCRHHRIARPAMLYRRKGPATSPAHQQHHCGRNGQPHRILVVPD